MADRKEVFVVTENKGKSYWNRIGVAFVNRDGSLSVHLDALPVTGKMQIRDPRPRDEQGPRRDSRREPEQTGFEDGYGSPEGDAVDDDPFI